MEEEAALSAELHVEMGKTVQVLEERIREMEVRRGGGELCASATMELLILLKRKISESRRLHLFSLFVLR